MQAGRRRFRSIRLTRRLPFRAYSTSVMHHLSEATRDTMNEGIMGEVALTDAEINARVAAYAARGGYEERRRRLWDRARDIIEPELRAFYIDLFRGQYGADESAT